MVTKCPALHVVMVTGVETSVTIFIKRLKKTQSAVEHDEEIKRRFFVKQMILENLLNVGLQCMNALFTCVRLKILYVDIENIQ